jgi:hypothetical protein
MKSENEERDSALAMMEDAISVANEAGVFCDACVKKIDTAYRPVDFCSTCHSVVLQWLASIIEHECAQMAAEEPGRFTITHQGGETYIKRHW